MLEVSFNMCAAQKLCRYFFFQVMNIFVTIGTVSIFTFISDEFEHYSASDVPNLLSQSFPRVGGYFVEFIMVKTMFGLPWELSRAWAGFLMISAWAFTDKRQWTMRSQRTAYLNYPELLYGWVYPSLLSVIAISMAYQVVAPVVSLFAFAYFLLAELVYKNNVLHVYTARTETGGTMWPGVVRSFVSVLALAHILIACFHLIRGAALQVTVMVIALAADALFLDYLHRAFEVPSKMAPLEIATHKDYLDHERGAVSNCQFSNQVYEQPSLRLESVEEEPFSEPTSPMAFMPENHADVDFCD